VDSGGVHDAPVWGGRVGGTRCGRAQGAHCFCHAFRLAGSWGQDSRCGGDVRRAPTEPAPAAGGLPELDVARVQRWCAGQVPEHVRDEIRVECDIAPRHLTICECRPPWREDFGPDWTRFPIARLHYTKTTRLWTLYRRDRNLKYHRYHPLDPSPQVQDLLDYLDERADPIFWG
jgi:Protein of unknown function (DUF3024)